MFKLMLVFHVLAATIWVGGHLVLSLTVLPRALRHRDVTILQEFEAGFERIGIPALIVQVVTGLWLAYRLIPDVGSWFSWESVASRHVTVKLVLLAVTLGLAVHARLRLIPRLNERLLPTLAWHVVLVTVVGVLFVVVGVGLRAGGVF